MSVWHRITAPWRQKDAGSPDWGVLERYLGWAFGGGVSASGIIVNPQNAMQAAAVFACIKVLAESLAMLPLLVYSEEADGDKKEARNHPLWELLHWAPNDYQTTTEFFELIVAHLCLRGNAYAWINRARSGRVVELIPLHPDMVQVTMNSRNELQYSVGMEGGGSKPVDRGEILHIRGQTLNGWLGISPIAYNRETIGLALATEKFGGQLFRNGAKPGGTLEVPQVLSDQAFARLQAGIDASTSGENAHRTMILEGGAKYTKIGMTSEDAQFLETRKYQRSEIAGVFRVPPHMIGDLEKATFGNIEEQNLQFATAGIQPLATRIERALRRDVFTPADKKAIVVKFDMLALTRGNSSQRAAYYGAGIKDGWMLRNEARRLENLNRIAGLDIPLMPLNMTDGREPPEDADALNKEPAKAAT